MEWSIAKSLEVHLIFSQNGSCNSSSEMYQEFCVALIDEIDSIGIG
jgi:hypothetical protein